jgi:preprotein translocase subunit SecG
MNEMGTLEIISAICLLLSCVFIIIMVLMQDSKKGMSQAITGGSSDNFYQKNSGRSKEARMARLTRTAAILFFIVTLVVNVFAIYFKNDEAPPPSDPLVGLEDIDWADPSILDDLSSLFDMDDNGNLTFEDEDDNGDPLPESEE